MCSLPTVPTQDWTNRAAQSLALASHHGYACVLLVADQGAGDPVPAFRVDSAGIAAGASLDESGSSEQDLASSMRVRLDRVRDVGFRVSDEMRRVGVVGRMGALNRNWRDTRLGQAWQGYANRDVLIAMVPLGEQRRGISLICMVGDPEPGFSVDAFAAISSTLRVRTEAMIARMEQRNGKGLKWLTIREQEVLYALIGGYSVREIAEQLGRSRHTVHDHVKSLHKKLNASSRGELVAAALGHLDPDLSTTLFPSMVVHPESLIAEVKPSIGFSATRL